MEKHWFIKNLPDGGTIKAAAQATGVTQGRFSDMFKGKHRAGLTVTQAQLLAAYLQVPLDEVAGQAGDAR